MQHHNLHNIQFLLNLIVRSFVGEEHQQRLRACQLQQWRREHPILFNS
jgi:hypothetical protein